LRRLNRQDKATMAAQASALQAPLALVQMPRNFAEVTRAEKAASHRAALRFEVAICCEKINFLMDFCPGYSGRPHYLQPGNDLQSRTLFMRLNDA
jgi:hypothetical protein